jgi:hypothetical protein
MKKMSTQEKFEKAQSDMNEKRFKTIKQACKFHEISQASYHIYRAKVKSRGIVKESPNSKEELLTRIDTLEEQNKKLKDTIISLLK